MASRQGLVISVEAVLAVAVAPVTMSMTLGHCQLRGIECYRLYRECVDVFVLLGLPSSSDSTAAQGL
jgi:hypothetical protein